MSITLAKILLIIPGGFGLFLFSLGINRVRSGQTNDLLFTIVTVLGLAESIFAVVLGLIL